MGRYFISGAGDIDEAKAHIGSALTAEQEWSMRVGGIIFSDPSRTDEESAALFQSFAPSVAPELDRIQALPDEITQHTQHLKDYLVKEPSTITGAETVHVVKDLIRAVRYMNQRLIDG